MVARTLSVLTLLVILCASMAVGQSNRITVQADAGTETINRHIYGHFAEHLGRGIYDGIWCRNAEGEIEIRDEVVEALRDVEIHNLGGRDCCVTDSGFRYVS